MFSPKNFFDVGEEHGNVPVHFLRGSMQQFQKQTSHDSPNPKSSLFGFLHGAFFGRHVAGKLSDRTAHELSNLQLPQRERVEDLPPPSFLKLQSAKGEPTIVSIRHEPCRDMHGGEQIHVSARHNCVGARHELEYLLVTAHNGDRLLKGTISETGRLPMVPGSYAPERPRVLMRFELAAQHPAQGEALWLLRDAWNLVEAFVDRGVWGVDQQLVESARLIGRANAHVHRSRRFKQELGEKTETTEPDPSTFLYDEPSDYYTVEPPHYEVYEDIRDAIRLLGALSVDELYLQTGAAVFERNEFETSQKDGGELEEYTSIPGLRTKERWFSRAIQADFCTPLEYAPAGVVLRLVTPFTRSDKAAKLDKLRLEILGPRGAFGLRERFCVENCNDILAVTEFSYNDELFRNLFRTLHQVNCAAISHDAKIQSVLDLLRQYDLEARVGNPQALLGTLRRGAFSRSKNARREQIELE
jgi:hypothetical protein